MAKGLGIGALIAALIGAVVPFIGFFIGVLALICAAIAALAGDRVLSIATVIVSIFVFLFLTPSLWIVSIAGALATETQQDEIGTNFLAIIAIVALALPIISVLLNSTGKIVIGTPRTPKENNSN